MEINHDDKHESLAFFGAMTASVSHELINVISIINELAGVLDDMLHAADHGQPIDMDRLGSLYERLNRQITRGEKTVKRLNMFAHTADVAKSEFDINLVLANFVSLMQRMADRKKVKLEYDSPDQSLKFTGNPFEFQHAVFRTIGFLLEASRSDSVIGLTAQKRDKDISVEIDGSDITTGSLKEGEMLKIKRLVESLGGQMQSRAEGNLFSIIFSLPIAY